MELEAREDAADPASPVKPERTRGRPLDRSRDEHILRITIELLNEIGIERVRMQDVAERAGVGLGTIYRRWPTKEYLVIAALKSVMHDDDLDADPPGFRDQALDLARILRGKEADLVPSVVAAMYNDPLLADTFRASWLDPRVDGLRAALQARVDTPLPDETIELIAEIVPAFLTYRVLLSHEPIEEDDLNRLTDMVILPLLGLHAGETKPPRRRRRSGS